MLRRGGRIREKSKQIRKIKTININKIKTINQKLHGSTTVITALLFIALSIKMEYFQAKYCTTVRCSLIYSW